METEQIENGASQRGPLFRISHAVGSATILAFACLLSYWLITTVLTREYSVSRDDDLLGGMWSVVATIFIYRSSYKKSADRDHRNHFGAGSPIRGHRHGSHYNCCRLGHLEADNNIENKPLRNSLILLIRFVTILRVTSHNSLKNVTRYRFFLLTKVFSTAALKIPILIISSPPKIDRCTWIEPLRPFFHRIRYIEPLDRGDIRVIPGRLMPVA
jgi:hypothetical protein